MANEEQLSVLKQGLKAWKKWRIENPRVRIDLEEADLWRTNFHGADLAEANLREANLIDAELGEAVLIRANLTRANLNRADLVGADLSEADLVGADLAEANLREANLREANLSGAIFVHINLEQSNFAGARLYSTIFGGSDLSDVLGLYDVSHEGPSTLGTDTIVKSRGKIPEIFLRGCGLSDADIEYSKLSNPDLTNEEISKILYKMYDLRASQALQISPLFISYSHADGTFVDKLESHLNEKGVRFWRDVHDATAGRLEKQIDRAIRQNATVLLVLSEYALHSDWVEHEVRTARELEKEMGRDVLCPVALDDSWNNSRWPKRIMEQIMEYNILDFSAWNDDSKFDGMFRKLIDGLELFYKG